MFRRRLVRTRFMGHSTRVGPATTVLEGETGTSMGTDMGTRVASTASIACVCRLGAQASFRTGAYAIGTGGDLLLKA